MMFFIKKITLLMLMLPLLSIAKESKHNAADESSHFSYGVGAFINNDVYKGNSARKMLIPFIGYKGDNLTVFGPFVSYKLKDVNDFKVFAKLAPRFQGFDSSDSVYFRGMEKRYSSLDAGVGMSYEKNNWKFVFSAMLDALSRSKGVELQSMISKTYRFGPVFVEPSVSLNYLNSNHVDYYYGVSENEATINRVFYHGKEAHNTRIGLSIATPIFFKGYTRFQIDYLFLDSSITNSPLVGKNSSLGVQFFFTKAF